MADKEQVELLKSDVEAWNQWREAHQEVRPDLSGVPLIRASLSGADLSGADLSAANLFEADLSWANLSKADLLGAGLSGANLIAAELSYADLREVDLSGANLSEAGLQMANLTHANLGGADLSRALLFDTILNRTILGGAEFTQTVLSFCVFGNTDLSATKGLDSCSYRGPCVIDYQTLQSSKSLPLPFLRGCGLPDHYIDYLPSLVNQPIQYYSCFISYSSKDEEFTQRLHADLQDNGVRCWYAPEHMKIGDKIRDSLHEGIRLHEKLLIILSDNSVTSNWVETEVEAAFDKERKDRKTVLFPIRLDDAVMDCETGWAADIKRRHIGNFCKWKDHDSYNRNFKRLLRDLKPDQDVRDCG